MKRFLIAILFLLIVAFSIKGQERTHLLPLQAAMSPNEHILKYEQAIGNYLVKDRTLPQNGLIVQFIMSTPEFPFAWRIDRDVDTAEDTIYLLTYKESVVNIWTHVFNNIPLPDTLTKRIDAKMDREDALSVEQLFHAALMTTSPPKEGYKSTYGEFNTFWYSTMHGKRLITSYSESADTPRAKQGDNISQLEAVVQEIASELKKQKNSGIFTFSPLLREKIKILTRKFKV